MFIYDSLENARNFSLTENPVAGRKYYLITAMVRATNSLVPRTLSIEFMKQLFASDYATEDGRGEK